MVKVISLSDEAYGILKRMKMGRSFSEVIVDVTTSKEKKGIVKDLSKFCGIWKDETEEWEKIKKKLYKDRKKAKLREVKW